MLGSHHVGQTLGRGGLAEVCSKSSLRESQGGREGGQCSLGAGGWARAGSEQALKNGKPGVMDLTIVSEESLASL